MPKRSYHDPIDCAQHLTPLKANNKNNQIELGQKSAFCTNYQILKVSFMKETLVNTHQLTAGAAELKWNKLLKPKVKVNSICEHICLHFLDAS